MLLERPIRYFNPIWAGIGQSNWGGLDTDLVGPPAWVQDIRAQYYLQGHHNFQVISPDDPITNQHGAELTASMLLAAAANPFGTSNNIYIAKWAQGGTLIELWLPGSSSPALWTNTQAMIAACKAAQPTNFNINWGLWLGETNAQAAFSPTAQQDFFNNGVTLLNDVAAEWGASYNIKYMIVQTSSSVGGPNNAAIQAAQVQLSQRPNSYLVQIPLVPNAGIHWGFGQQLIIGNSYIGPAIINAWTY